MWLPEQAAIRTACFKGFTRRLLWIQCRCPTLPMGTCTNSHLRKECAGPVGAVTRQLTDTAVPDSAQSSIVSLVVLHLAFPEPVLLSRHADCFVPR